ncbi:hypothetical protein BGX38DRAFT_1274841 [Terfezia claveryi]|nr:hypothetical protein BGX38DRAFT_1274841 [Terfezia claveryi]
MRAPPVDNRSSPVHIQYPQRLQRSKTEGLSKSRRGDIVPPRSSPRAMTSFTAPPRMSYCPRSAQDNSNTLSQLSNIIWSVAMGLAPKLTKFPGFCKLPNGECEAVKEIEHQFEDYETAFSAERGHRHSKPSAIAAVISTYVWDTIQEYRIFMDDAAVDLKVLAKLSDNPDPDHSSEELDEEIYAARMVMHGAGRELKSDSRAEKKVLEEMRPLYKHFFKDQSDAEGKRLICVELGKHVWEYAMELKNQKGRIEITFDPKCTTSRYQQDLRQRGLQISYFEEQRQPNQQDSTGRRSAPPVLWFPEVTLYRRRFDAEETAVIFHAKYSRDLGRLIERAEYVEQQLLTRKSHDTTDTAYRGSVDPETLERKRTMSLGALVAANRGALPISDNHRGTRREGQHSVSIGPIPGSQGTDSDSTLVGLPTSKVRGIPGARHNENPNASTRPRGYESEKSPRSLSRPTGRIQGEGASQGGIFSRIIKLILNLFRKKSSPSGNLRTLEPTAKRHRRPKV